MLNRRSQRPGATLDRPQEHREDHRLWSRRSFLKGAGLFGFGLGHALDALPLWAAGLEQTERVLLLVQLQGGNDGLNTVIPYGDDAYYASRPRLAIEAAEVLPLDGHLGLHPALQPLLPLWDDGRMAVAQNVGYPEPNLSHFASTDIWSSGADDEGGATGWIGRYLDRTHPQYAEQSPAHPLALSTGGGGLLTQGPQGNMGITFARTSRNLERLLATGELYPTDELPDTARGRERGFLRKVANEALSFTGTVGRSLQEGRNSVEYSPSSLASQMASIARLIKGGLRTGIYMVRLNGFDTHTGQPGRHANLMGQLASAVRDFYADLGADGLGDAALTMTFSEFGRRVRENASVGTDHGTAAPVLLFGRGANPGLWGPPPDLGDLDGRGNLRFAVDFRRIYADILQNWFGGDPALTADILGAPFDPLGLVSPLPGRDGGTAAPTAVGEGQRPLRLSLEQNYPNPFNPTTYIEYALDAPARVVLKVYNAIGQEIARPVDRHQAAGRYRVRFEAGDRPSGTYTYLLQAGTRSYSRRMTLQK